MKISLCMIVKNEEKYIRMCLENAFKLADEAIIVDTGSTDKTIDIINEFGDKVKLIKYQWKNDFSEARNISLEEAAGDWILMLDADEKLLCDVDLLKELLENTDKEALTIPLYNILDRDTILFSEVYCKLFRNRGYRYSGAIHEQLSVEYSEIGNIPVENAKIMHYGYLAEVMTEKNKLKRNLTITREEYKKHPNSHFVNFNLGMAYMNDFQYQKALKYLFKCNSILEKQMIGKTASYETELSSAIAECLYRLKNYNHCIFLLEELLKDQKYNNSPDFCYTLANCYFETKNYDKALMYYRKCLNIGEKRETTGIRGKGSFYPKLKIANIYSKQNRVMDAAAMYIEAVFDPNNISKTGADEAREYLKNNNLDAILNELNVILSGSKQ